MAKKDISDALIETLRLTVEKRYQYDNLKKTIKLDEIVTEEKVDEIRTFFLKYVYPEAEARHVLNAAFDNLDKHFKNPIHLLDLLGSGAAVALKFGFQFPKAIRAALKTLDSFKKAMAFEQTLCNEAIQQNIKVPVSPTEFERLLSTLPVEQVTDFIESSDELLASLTDTKLLKKSIEILEDLVIKLKSKPKIYDHFDIDGMVTGLEILKGGYNLFSTMSEKEKETMIKLIIEVEHQNMQRIYEQYKVSA
jgi:hypothetical protein